MLFSRSMQASVNIVNTFRRVNYGPTSECPQERAKFHHLSCLIQVKSDAEIAFSLINKSN